MSFFLRALITFAIVMTSLSEAHAEITLQEGKQMVTAYRGLNESEKSVINTFLSENGIGTEWLQNNSLKNICVEALAPALLAGYASPRVKALKQIATADMHVEVVLRAVLLEGKPFGLGYFMGSRTHIDRFQTSGFNFLEIPEYAKSLQVSTLNVPAVAKSVATLAKGVPSPHKTLIYIQGTSAQGALSTEVALAFENGKTLSLHLKDADLHGATAEEFLAEVIYAAIIQRELLDSALNFNREVNMLAYDLKKLLRVADSKTQLSIRALTQNLPLVTDSSIRDPEVLGMAFLTLINIKRELVILAQEKGHELANEIARFREANGKQPNLGYRVHYNKLTEGEPTPAGYASRRLRSHGRGYYDVQRREDSTFISTYAWIMDPTFMLTHPWYWGVEDNGFLAPFLLMQMMQHRDLHDPGPNVFNRNTPYDPRLFEKPLDPVYHQGKDLPVADAWNAPMRPDVIQPVVSNAGVSWQKPNGQEVIVDRQTLDRRWADFVGDNQSLWSQVEETAATEGGRSGAKWVSAEGVLGVHTETLEDPDRFFRADEEGEDQSATVTDEQS